MPHNYNYGDDSPIAAFATTPGNSALTLIRCSGKGSIELFSSVFTANTELPAEVTQTDASPAEKHSSAKIKKASGNTVIHGWIIACDTGRQGFEKIDEVLVSVFRAPKSYTGEDSLDICCHGGFAAGKAVLEALKSAGFRDALPGEFTFRAFMNGKLDLTRSESVMEIVSAKTETSRRHAITRLSGSLYIEISEIKSLLVQVLAAAEIYLDYSEDEISADTSDDESFAEEASGRLPNKDIALAALAKLKKLSASRQIERLYQEGVTVVIAGRPNSGKSSLFNLLLKEDRSIVTEIPGTTRDWIEAWVSIEGVPVRLIDTAGLRDVDDTVEKIGVERSRQLIEEADLVLYLIDGTQGITNDDVILISELLQKNYQTLILWNKIDIAKSDKHPNDLLSSVFREPLVKRLCANIIKISSKTGEGLNELHTKINSVIVPDNNAQLSETQMSAALGTERQKNLVDTACTLLEEALELAEQEEPLDIIAPLLREAVNALGEITGEVSTADILEEMFSKFCVGK